MWNRMSELWCLAIHRKHVGHAEIHGDLISNGKWLTTLRIVLFLRILSCIRAVPNTYSSKLFVLGSILIGCDPACSQFSHVISFHQVFRQRFCMHFSYPYVRSHFFLRSEYFQNCVLWHTESTECPNEGIQNKRFISRKLIVIHVSGLRHRKGKLSCPAYARANFAVDTLERIDSSVTRFPPPSVLLGRGGVPCQWSCKQVRTTAVKIHMSHVSWREAAA
jgi:hypothetical protein